MLKKIDWDYIFGFCLFIGLFIVLLPIMMISGAILRPVRYFKYVVAKVQDKEPKKYDW